MENEATTFTQQQQQQQQQEEQNVPQQIDLTEDDEEDDDEEEEDEEMEEEGYEGNTYFYLDTTLYFHCPQTSFYISNISVSNLLLSLSQTSHFDYTQS